MAEIEMRAYRAEDVPQMAEIWNAVVRAGDAFPQIEEVDGREAEALFAEQSFAGVAAWDEEILGLYILHPNNVGRCGHIANASFAVKPDLRGMGSAKGSWGTVSPGGGRWDSGSCSSTRWSPPTSGRTGSTRGWVSAASGRFPADSC